MEEGGLKDILVRPNQRRYPGQVVLVVAYRGYVCLVPSAEEEEHYCLKTVIPSRRASRCRTCDFRKEPTREHPSFRGRSHGHSGPCV